MKVWVVNVHYEDECLVLGVYANKDLAVAAIKKDYLEECENDKGYCKPTFEEDLYTHHDGSFHVEYGPTNWVAEEHELEVA